jgi:tetratricopeptide (TPR) repeat protein
MIDKIRQAKAHYERGHQLDEAGDTARAIQEWEIAIQLNPHYFDAHYNLGIACADEGDLTRAVDEMETALGLEPDDADARRELVEMLRERGDALLAQKDAAHAIQDWERALELDSGNALLHFKLGKLFADRGELADAGDHFRAAIKANRFFTDAYDQLAEILVTQDRTRDAIALLRQALNTFSASPRFGDGLYGRAGFPKAESLPVDVSVSDLARELAELELDGGNPDQAMVALEQAQPEKDDAELWRDLAQAFDVRGDGPSAEIARNRAAELGQLPEDETAAAAPPENPAGAHYAQGEYLFERGEFDAAFDAYERAVDANPEHAEAHYGMGVVYQQDEEYDLAEQEFRAVLRIDPNHADAHFGLGEIFDTRQDWQNAIQEYRAALRIAPNDADARERLIWNLLETNAPSDAQAELERALLKSETAAELWQAVGEAYEERGEPAHAIAAYERALGLSKKSKGARDGLKRMRA